MRHRRRMRARRDVWQASSTLELKLTAAGAAMSAANAQALATLTQLESVSKRACCCRCCCYRSLSTVCLKFAPALVVSLACCVSSSSAPAICALLVMRRPTVGARFSQRLSQGLTANSAAKQLASSAHTQYITQAPVCLLAIQPAPLLFALKLAHNIWAQLHNASSVLCVCVSPTCFECAIAMRAPSLKCIAYERARLQARTKSRQASQLAS